MTTNDITAIRKLTNAATPGPWRADESEVYTDDLQSIADDQSWVAETMKDDDPGATRADAEFIAAARTLVPALCDEIEHLRTSIKQLIDFRNAKVWEADQLAQRLRTVRALAEGANGDGDFGSVSASDLLAALGEPHPAESRPAIEFDEDDSCDHRISLDVECESCLVDTYGQRDAEVTR